MSKVKLSVQPSPATTWAWDGGPIMHGPMTIEDVADALHGQAEKLRAEMGDDPSREFDVRYISNSDIAVIVVRRSAKRKQTSPRRRSRRTKV